MRKPEYLLYQAGILSLCVLGCCTGVALATGQDSSVSALENRSDIVIIDNIKSFGPLQKATVEFLHDAHTDALLKINRSCDSCHPQDKEQLSLFFKRLQNTDKETVMNIYHDGCISCHGEMRLKGEKTGPIECDSCHREQKKFTVSHLAMGFDKSLHARHIDAHKKKCETCHHEYDATTKKLFYAKGKEGTCRYCHLEKTQGNTVSMRESSHIACINCHLKNQKTSPLDLPVKCSQCHDALERKKIKILETIPRLERNQPDSIMIKTGDESLDANTNHRMDFVPFDHKAHEGYNDTCRVCHHKSIKKCSDCHTLSGDEAGKNINIELAIHKKDTDHSCVGCHTKQYKKNNNCAGCHQAISINSKMSDSSCKVCHIPLSNGIQADDETAKILLKLRPKSPASFAQNEIPEKLTIGKLSNKYQAVDFPHRKIVNSIATKIAGSKLALHFHAQKHTTCSGCHHNGPPSKQPSGCESCHSKRFNTNDMHKPGIMAAYHLQCMECHTSMKINKLGCTDCHAKKIPQSSAQTKGNE